jgi:hypothetical protein
MIQLVLRSPQQASQRDLRWSEPWPTLFETIPCPTKLCIERDKKEEKIRIQSVKTRQTRKDSVEHYLGLNKVTHRLDKPNEVVVKNNDIMELVSVRQK